MATEKLEKKEFAATFLGVPGLETQIDEQAGVIRGVSVITEGPAMNGGGVPRLDKASGLPVFIDRKSLEQVRDTASEYQGGLKVKADHGSGIFATTGMLRNFRIEIGKDGLARTRADLHVLQTDPNKAKLFEMARTIPDGFGLSIACGGEDETRGDRVNLRCTEIYSADLVPEPAANPTGLFGRQVDAGKNSKSSTEPPPTMEPADILKQCGAMLDSAKAEMGKRFEAHENSLAELKKMMGSVGDGVTGSQSKAEHFSALQDQVKTLGAAVTTLTTESGNFKKELETLPTRMAKEFAATIGTTTTRSGAADGGQGAGAAAAKAGTREGFESLVQKHFAACHSKTTAMSKAITEDEAGYKAFMASGASNVKYV